MQAKSKPTATTKAAAGSAEQKGLWKGQNSQLSESTQFGGDLPVSRSGEASSLGLSLASCGHSFWVESHHCLGHCSGHIFLYSLAVQTIEWFSYSEISAERRQYSKWSVTCRQCGRQSQSASFGSETHVSQAQSLSPRTRVTCNALQRPCTSTAAAHLQGSNRASNPGGEHPLGSST